MFYALVREKELFLIFAEDEEKRYALNTVRNRTIYFNTIFLILVHFQSIPTPGVTETSSSKQISAGLSMTAYVTEGARRQAKD